MTSDGPTLRIVVVGAGAVGGAVGALLASAGHEVTLVARGEHGRRMARDGVVIVTPESRIRMHPAVVSDVGEAERGRADVVLVCVKAADLAGVAPHVGALLGARGVAIPLLNGLDSEAALADHLGRDRVIGAVAQIASQVEEPGRIRIEGPPRLVLAPLDPAGLPRTQEVARALTGPGLACDARPDLTRLLWNKLLWNAPFNAVCALTRRSAGGVLEIAELAALVRTAMREVAAVARAEGVAIDDRAVDANLEATRSKYAATVPSMLQDVLRGRPTEARALQGAVVDRARKHGIEVPVHETLFGLMLGLEPPPKDS